MAQLVRAPPCHGGGRGFESHSGRLQETLSVDCLIKLSWDHSSAGRASALQAEGHRFEPYWSHWYADVAQLAEQLICNQQVIGSSPIIGFSQFILRIKMSQFHIERFKWADSRVAKGDRL